MPKPTSFVFSQVVACDPNKCIARLFACYLGQLETADTPPHLWVSNEPDTPADGADLPDIERLTNESFEPVFLPEQGWQHVPWPPELRFNPLPSGNTSWLFESDETWYLGHAVP